MFVIYYKKPGYPRKYLGDNKLVSRLQYAKAWPESLRAEAEKHGFNTQTVNCSPVADVMYKGPVQVCKIAW